MRLAPEVVTSIQTMAKDNALWGAERIRGELLKLGICVSKRTIQKYMRHVRPSGSRGQTWRTFIRNHSGDIWACDFLQLYDIFFRPIFAFFFVVHGTREVIRCNVTRCPTDALVAQQLREATPYCSGPRYLIEDHYRGKIRMEDLCRYTGVSLRTLQRAFLAYFQASPCDYIKARRLNAARQALVAADSSTGQVARIAVANGCTHLGRFSVDYREHFGELPRETLARSWNGQGIGFPAETFALDSTRQNNWPAE